MRNDGELPRLRGHASDLERPGGPDLRELRLIRSVGCREETRDFTALAVPLVHNRETFCVFGLSDSREPEVKNAIEQFFSRQVSQAQAPG